MVVLSWNLVCCNGVEVGAGCCIWTNYREYVQKNLHWCFHTRKLVRLAVLSLKCMFFLTWYLDLSESVHWRTSLGRACRPQSLSTLKEETVNCVDGLGKWRNAALSPVPVGISRELTDVLDVLATSICRDRRVQRLLLGWCCTVINLEWLVYLSRPTRVEAGHNLKESLTVCLLQFLNYAIATPVTLYLKIFGFPAGPFTLLCTVFPFTLF